MASHAISRRDVNRIEPENLRANARQLCARVVNERKPLYSSMVFVCRDQLEARRSRLKP